MKIPKRFKLHGITVEVVNNPTMGHYDDRRGAAWFRRNSIEIQPSCEGSPVPAESIEQTFCHELMHYLFHHAGCPEDRDNELKVDLMGSLLHQALTTMEYED